ncbi:DUF3343 domain-containing protein [Fusobacterium sp. PH5-44]|uniref:DUF3343 domain-containing protein n=1 Tax=unclassified Fusobacterium TaxID=2648384 RepID=UPI003D1D6382
MKLSKSKIYITFNSTNEALSMERIAKEQHFPGRLLPVPRKISEICGMAWAIDSEEKKLIENFIKINNISYREIEELTLK